MCLVLLPTSLAKHSHSYGMDFEIHELHCHAHTVFCIGHNFEIIIGGEMLGTPTQCHTIMICDDTGQKTRRKLIPCCLTTTSITTEIMSLKNFNWLLHIDSGSCSGSNLKYWLQLRLQPKMHTPAAVHSGSPAPWSSLICLAVLCSLPASTNAMLLNRRGTPPHRWRH